MKPGHEIRKHTFVGPGIRNMQIRQGPRLTHCSCGTTTAPLAKASVAPAIPYVIPLRSEIAASAVNPGTVICALHSFSKSLFLSLSRFFRLRPESRRASLASSSTRALLRSGWVRSCRLPVNASSQHGRTSTISHAYVSESVGSIPPGTVPRPPHALLGGGTNGTNGFSSIVSPVFETPTTLPGTTAQHGTLDVGVRIDVNG